MRLVRESLDTHKPDGFANIYVGLKKAFKVLKESRSTRIGKTGEIKSFSHTNNQICEESLQVCVANLIFGWDVGRDEPNPLVLDHCPTPTAFRQWTRIYKETRGMARTVKRTQTRTAGRTRSGTLTAERMRSVPYRNCSSLSLIAGYYTLFVVIETFVFYLGSAGTRCNQIIMLITEGLDYDYNATELFETSGDDNKPDKTGYRPVRIFTFLVGTDPEDSKEMRYIACTNMGKKIMFKLPLGIRFSYLVRQIIL